MILPNEKPYRLKLQNGLTLQTATDEAQVSQIAKLHTEVHDETTGEMFYKIALQHPHVTGRDIPYICDDKGRALASVCLIPWTLNYGPTPIRASELAIVSTSESHRQQGLNRALMSYYWLRMAERKSVLSIIQGIPNFYRQYGYDYALQPLIGGYRIQQDQIPESVVGPFNFRFANAKDIPSLSQWFDKANTIFQISAQRSIETWSYLFEPSREIEAMHHDTFIISDAKQTDLGYFRVPQFHFNPELLAIDECSELPVEAAMAVLQYASRLATERGKLGIRLQLPRESGLAKVAIAHGAHLLDPYSWQMRITDPALFLRQIKGLLEKRLARSMYAKLTLKMGLRFYSSTIGVDIREGRIVAIEHRLKASTTVMSLPIQLLVPLLMGGRSMSELHTFYPDVSVQEPWGPLVDTLFPKASLYLATQY